MEIGILGLASSGKSTVFALLTGQSGGGRRDVAATAMASVPDPRLDTLSAMYEPRKTTPASIRYVDVPGIPAEPGRESTLSIPEMRTMDVLMVVVRDFENDAVPHPMTTIDPVRDLARIDEELVLQDLMVVEKRIERLRRDLARRRAPDLEREMQILERCRGCLEEGRALREESWSADEEKRLRGFTFLSLKPMLVVVNLDESRVAGSPFAAPAWSGWRERPRMGFSSVSAALERELSDLDGEDADAFMADLGLTDRALDRIIRSSYELLGLISFFTVGEDECRAWSIRRGTPAVQAARAIHSDIERGFIRAEVVPWDVLVEAGSLTECRTRGSLRLEGKTYEVADGEVVHFRFNV
jgi:GTP-binding protein YchF